MRGWQPAGLAAGAEPKPAPSPSPPPMLPEALTRSPFMHASMPLMASTADAFARQFYSPAKLPQQRMMPTAKGGRP